MSDKKFHDMLEFLQQRSPTVYPQNAEVQGGGWQHWQLYSDDDNVGWLVFDRQDSSVNSLNEAALEELDSVLGQLEFQLPAALVICSGKTSGFCAGADIGMFRGMEDPELAMSRLRRAHDVVDRLQALPCKTIAVISGVCLGGGLELALGCNSRIASRDSKFGFPEVQLGLHPGLGGTYRSAALMGPMAAMELMLKGKTVSATRAQALGLVDAVTEPRHLPAVIAAARGGELKRKHPPWYSFLLRTAPGRKLLAAILERATSGKVKRQHYPAPFQLIDLWRRWGGDEELMQAGEIRSFANLVTSVKGQNLVRVFFLRETLKQQADRTLAEEIQHVHVIGAGAMGGDIAAWCALQGFSVSLSDRDPDIIADAVCRAADLARHKHLRGSDRQAFLDRLIPDPAARGLAHADLIIEAVPEKVEIKREVYAQVVANMKPDAILATNTSSIPLETLREELAIADRFLGLHFFNPVSRMQLVEVVLHDGVSDSARQLASAFVAGIDRLPVPVRSLPGFLVNRVLTPYLLEAMLILDEGVAPETLDEAALQFGMPMGPAELADQIGLDICLDVADMLQDEFSAPLPPVPDWIRDKVADGHLGRKTGQGLYHWSDNKPQKGSAEQLSDELVERLILPLVNTCVECLRQGVVENEEILDGAMIFGTGFAPFTGGPLHFARSRGVDELQQKLNELAQQKGERFEPDEGWKQLE